MSYNGREMFQDIFGMLFLSGVEYLNTLSVLVYIELLVGTLKILNHKILMMEYCSTDKA